MLTTMKTNAPHLLCRLGWVLALLLTVSLPLSTFPVTAHGMPAMAAEAVMMDCASPHQSECTERCPCCVGVCPMGSLMAVVSVGHQPVQVMGSIHPLSFAPGNVSTPLNQLLRPPARVS
ncbi:hypothetical protein SAMN04488540_12054 [Ferrimonas sediminum]|uniref:Uncharacterized protein n=1 Tax=Ferrimonas sediminum TaxID=718193 RepID=A0A1G8ZPF6_9GAMM|nr:hypothetical protein SAMN04488540_12054 [Ferrimonas sediminum]